MDGFEENGKPEETEETSFTLDDILNEIEAGSGAADEKKDGKKTETPYVVNGSVLKGDTIKDKKIEGFLKAFVPLKGDAKNEIIRKFVFLASLAAALVCCAIIIADAGHSTARRRLDDELKEIKSRGDVLSIDDNRAGEETDGEAEIAPKFRELYERNNDFVGWIKLGDTIIDYPVVQAADNDYYLKIDFDGGDDKAGSIFADWHIPINPYRRPEIFKDYGWYLPVKAGRRPDNTVLYGHNMANGTMFAHAARYYAPNFGLDAYVKNPTITFETLYGVERSTYKIFAGIYVNTKTEHGDVFSYYRARRFSEGDFYEKTGSTAENNFYYFISEIMDRSVFHTGVDIEYGDEILTLSTCYYPLGNNIDTRFALFARRVREGEDENVDTDAASRNLRPKYFDYFYSVMGGVPWTQDDRSWDVSLVKGMDEFLKTHSPEDNPWVKPAG
ncbi:MAG: class B sortase [Oscillospiraceae bacterium]|jgi:sortase B|nr:class B sortase [Oscillospiraceae bacterium]